MKKAHPNRYTRILQQIIAFAENGEDIERWKLLALGPAAIPAVRVATFNNWPARRVETLRREIRDFLRAAIPRDDRHVGLGRPIHVSIAVTPRVSPRAFAAAPWEPPGHVGLHVDGSIRSIVFFNLVIVLRQTGVARLRRCDCGRVFVKVGRRQSCSSACYKRTYMRKYRAGEVGGE